MANNTTLNTGSGGDTIRDLDRAGVKTQVVALDLNPAGSETLMAGAMPVSGTFWQATQPVSLAAAVTVSQATAASLNATVVGTVTANAGSGTFAVSAASLPLPSGASTAAKQPAPGTAGTASSDVLTVQGIASMTALKVDASATTQPVSGTFWQATQPVSLASVVHVDDNSGSLTVDNGGTFAVQAAQSGNWTARLVGNAGAIIDAAGQNASSPANSLLVGGQFNTSPTSITSGNMSPLQLDASGNLKVNVSAGGGSGGTSSSFGSAFPSTGTAIGATDGTNLKALTVDASGFLKVNVAAGGGSGGTSSSYGAAVPSTGTAAGYSDGTNMQLARLFDADSGAGTQYVLGVGLRKVASGGSVEAGTSTDPIRTDPTGTTTQPVSGTVTANAGTNLNTSLLALESGGNLATIATRTPALGQALAAAAVPVVLTAAQVTTLTPLTTVAVTGTFWQATQPISGTVTANIGTSGSLALDATLTGGTQKSKLVDSAGTNVATVSAGGALKVDASATTQPVSGTFWQATQPVSGTVTANAGTGTLAVSAASLPLPSGASTAAKQPAPGTAGTASSDVLTVQGIASMTALKVDASATTQPVSGTVAATQSGAWTVQPGNTANSTAWLVTGTGGTFPATQSGTWNVGSVTAVTAITNALPAGTNLLGQVSASNETGTVYSGTAALTPKFAIITASSSGATTVVAAVTSKKLRVLRWRASANGTVNIKWQSHVTPTDKSGLSYCVQYKDVGGGYCPVGHFETISGEALDINLSGAVAVSGELTYIEV